MKRIFILLAVFISFLQAGYSQTIIPPSPDAQNQMRGAANVSYYTGALNYSIPLFTITEGNITVPITLSYTGNGIRVNDEPAWCGLGWTLNAGGLITRTVIGQPDETPGTGFIDYAGRGKLAIGTSGVNLGRLTSYPQIDSLKKGLIDGEPDIYKFSVPGISGSILQDTNGHFVCSPSHDIWVEPDTTIWYGALREPINLFSDENFYLFTPAPSETHTFQQIDETSNPIQYLETTVYSTNSWYLSLIHSLQGNGVFFYYDNFYYGKYIYNPGNTYFRPVTGSDNLFAQQPTYTDQYNYVPHLTEIDFTSGKILFIPTTHIRYDLPVVGSHALDKIIIENNQGKIIKQYKFNYDYWYCKDYPIESSRLIPFDSLVIPNEGSVSSYLPDSTYDYYRLMLRSIVELDSSGNAINAGTRFEYNLSNFFPPRGSSRGQDYTDYWGYFNNLNHWELGEDLIYNPWQFPNPPYPNRDNPLKTLTQIMDISCLEPNSNAISGSLKTIYTPTGLKEEITYENNYGNYPAALTPIPPIAGPGIRVSSINISDSTNSTTTFTAFGYDNGGCSYIPFTRGVFSLYNPNIGSSQQYEFLNLNGPAESNDPIGYGKVEVYQAKGNIGEYPDPLSKTTYTFASPSSPYYADPIPQITDASYSGYAFNAPHNETRNFMRGQVLARESYITNPDTMALKKRVVTGYDEYFIPLVPSVRMHPFSNIPDIYDNSSYTIYNQYTGAGEPLTIRETDYDNGDSLNTEEFIGYNATDFKYQPLQVSSINKYYPEGGYTADYFLYPNNFINLPIQNNDDQTLESHIHYNRSKIIEHVTTSTRFDGTNYNTNVISAELFKYNGGQDIDSIYRLEGVPIPFSNFRFSNTFTSGLFQGYTVSASITPDSHYRLAKKLRWNLRRAYDGYDLNPAVDGLSESIDLTTGDTTSYISLLSRFDGSFLNSSGGSAYGYPSAIIKGASYDQVIGQLSPSTWTSDAAFSADIDHLRTVLPHSSISTIIYRPMVGPVSVTSPTGDILYTDYDKVGRPRYKRDKDGHILEITEYHNKWPQH